MVLLNPNVIPMKNRLILLFSLWPLLASAQIPLISGDTKIKFSKGDLTWLARVDTLAKYLFSELPDSSDTNEGSLSASGTHPSMYIHSNTSGSPSIQLNAGDGIFFDRTLNAIDIYNTGVLGSGASNQVPVFTNDNTVASSNAFKYETNTLSLNPAARDTHFVINETTNRKFGIQAIQDTFNSGVNAWKMGALNRAGRVYLTSEETYIEGALKQVTGGGIPFTGTTGSMFMHMNGDYYTATTTGANATTNRNMHWYFKSGGINNELGNPMVFQHTFDGNDTTGNCFEFLARNLAGGGITHPDSTLFRVGNWDRGTALEIKHRGRIGIGTRSPSYTLDINATDGIRIPVGTTAQRPTGAAGVIRYNTDSTAVEWHNGSTWAKFGSGGGGSGEANTASNVGSGSGWFKQKTGVDLEFKSFVAGGGVTVTSNTNDLTVATTAPQPASSETIETTNFTATMRRINLVDCSGGTISVTPPTSPAIGDRFAVVDAEATAGTNNITINFSGSSQKLYATVQNYILNVNGGYVEFIYMGSTTGWVATKG